MWAPARFSSTLSRLRGSSGGSPASGIPDFIKPFRDWTTLKLCVNLESKNKFFFYILRHCTTSWSLSRHRLRSVTMSPFVSKIQLRKIRVFLTSMLSWRRLVRFWCRVTSQEKWEALEWNFYVHFLDCQHSTYQRQYNIKLVLNSFGQLRTDLLASATKIFLFIRVNKRSFGLLMGKISWETYIWRALSSRSYQISRLTEHIILFLFH